MDNQTIAEQGLILECETGSTAFGLQTPESDKDIHGLCIEPPSIVICGGFHQFKRRTDHDGIPIGDNDKTPPRGCERTIIPLRTWVPTALKGNVSPLLPLFVESVLFTTDWGNTLRDNRKLFISKQTYSMARYLRHEVEDMASQANSRTALDPKRVYQTGKLILLAISLLKDHRLFIDGDWLTWLRNVRDEGRNFSIDCVDVAVLQALLKELDKQFQASTLPDKIDLERVHKLVTHLYVSFWKVNQWL